MQCPCCLLAWTEGVELDPAAFYDQSYFDDVDSPKGYNDYFSLASAMERTCDARIRRLRRLMPGARSLLDAGRETWGLEVSAFAARFGRDRLGQRIVNGPIDAVHLDRIESSFDLITMWDTIEHLAAPDEAIALLADKLEPGGVMSLSTGDVAALAARLTGRAWHLFNLPEHLWFFSVPALKRLCRRAGLEVLRVEREVCWYTAQYLLDRLMYSLGRNALRFRGDSILKRLSVPISLFDIVTIHARKPATTRNAEVERHESELQAPARKFAVAEPFGAREPARLRSRLGSMVS
jgi:SAM-dependent methyltransferase